MSLHVRPSSPSLHVRLAACLMGVAGATTPLLSQQTPPPAPTPAQPGVASPVPQRETLNRLTRPITIEFADQRLEDVLTFITEFTGADIEPMWADDRNTDGLDKETPITMRATAVPALTLIERILAKAAGTTSFEGNTWQLSESGSLQIGPKSRLNADKRLEIYDISDLLVEVPDYEDAPEIDLQQAISASQGGGGGQSPFNQNEEEEEQDDERREARARELIDLITELVEFDQWVENGGSGGTIRLYANTLIVNAPDYMHRQLNGYPYWPANQTRVGTARGRRYVTLDMDAGISTLDGIAQEPITIPGPR